jgi:hypothetical protein
MYTDKLLALPRDEVTFPVNNTTDLAKNLKKE